MNYVFVFTAPTIDANTCEKLAGLLRIREIATTGHVPNMIMVIADIQKPVEPMDIAILAEKLVDETIHKVSILAHEISSFNKNAKQQKPIVRNSLKQFYQTKQNYKQRFLTRTQCK